MTDRVEQLQAQGGLKWTYHDEDVLAAWVAEMDFGLAPSVTEALHEAIDRGLTGYPYPDLETRVASEAVAFWADELDWSVEPSWVFPAPDVIEGIRRAIMLLTAPGTPVVLHSPVYFPFYSMVERAGRDVVEVRCHQDDRGRYNLNLDGIERALDDGAGSIVLCNPWNPTGRSLDHNELDDLAQIVAKHGARVISDEVHAPLTYSETSHTAIAGLAPDLVATVTSASKAWNLPGLKCAQVVLTNSCDRAIWSDYFTPDKVGVGTLGLVAAVAAYADGRDWLTQVMGRLEANRDLVARLVATHLPHARYTPPEATYLAWVDLAGYEITDPGAFLLDEAKVALTSGKPFGSGADNWVRINFGTDAEIVEELMRRIGTALSD